MKLRTATGAAEVRASGVRRLGVPRHQPWGPSASVNKVDLTGQRLEVEMQSGDPIVVEALELQVP